MKTARGRFGWWQRSCTTQLLPRLLVVFVIIAVVPILLLLQERTCGGSCDAFVVVVRPLSRPQQKTIPPNNKATAAAGLLSARSRPRTLPFFQHQQHQLDVAVAADTETTTTTTTSATWQEESSTNSTTSGYDDGRNDTDKLWSYAYNLHMVQRQDRQQQQPGQRRRGNKKDDNNKRKAQLLKPARSLVHFLESNRYSEFAAATAAAAIRGAENNSYDTVTEPLGRAVVQAVRVAAQVNDYRLILQIYDAVFQYCANNNDDDVPGILDPRILGETISALSKTSVNLGKIKRVWNQATTATSGDGAGRGWWSRPIGPRQVNAMLNALAQFGKIRNILDLVQAFPTDSYSLSIVLNALTDSISTDPPTKDDADEDNNKMYLSIYHVNLQNSELEALLLGSCCWQWREAVIMLDRNEDMINNPVITALLRLNVRATQSCFRCRHDGPGYAIFLQRYMMEKLGIVPDAVTCTLLLSNMGNEWEYAMEFLQKCHQQHSNLPLPNVYMYGSAMAVCARSRQYAVTLELLEQVEEPNIWMYNSVLQALTAKTAKRSTCRKRKPKRSVRLQAKERLGIALKLWERMRTSEIISPDTVTCNTFLAVVAGTRALLRTPDWDDLAQKFPDHFENVSPACFADALLDWMEKHNVPRDSLTYKHASLAVSHESVVHIIERALMEDSSTVRKEMLGIFNAGLSVLADAGDFDAVLIHLKLMEKDRTAMDADSVTHILKCLANARLTTVIPILLAIETLADNAARMKGTLAGIDLVKMVSPFLDVPHYSFSISCCLQARDFQCARKILKFMRDSGLRLPSDSLKEMARTYATISLQYDAEQTGKNTTSTRARSAYAMFKNVNNPPSSLVSIVSRACCSAGLFWESYRLLRLLHNRVLEHHYQEQNGPITLSRMDTTERIISSLHRSLLKYCAAQGNVTNALRLCEDIQYLSLQLKGAKNGRSTSVKDEQSVSDLAFDFNRFAGVEPENGVGMKAEEWKLLLLAASKSRHWRVCLTTLQFLRPYLEATHPSLAKTAEDRLRQDREYGRLESSMNAAMKCLAVRSQYAWIVRAMNEWILWSGRRPPRESVLAAIRVLAARGRGEEVTSLLSRCTSMPSSNTRCDDQRYEPSLFAGAVTALHNEGLYDQADDAFVAAVSKSALPFCLERVSYGVENRITLDLHGMNLAVAHSAVRIALQQEAMTASWNRTELWDNDIVIVTGRGLNSALKMRPVLRPEVQRMLVEEFYPPLNTNSVPGNMGALRISADDVSEWLSHQRQQKGARMLMVAAMLKDLSSPISRLQATLSQAVQTNTFAQAFNESHDSG